MSDHIAKLIDPASLFATLRHWDPRDRSRPAGKGGHPPAPAKPDSLPAGMDDDDPLRRIPGLDVGNALRRLLGKRASH
ncbi:hypothetical protein BI347_03855 [Chromobacterium sphagni]|uniref:Uncharacterized protein n=1 Tax=Chromobacterium sphagni TaxID=1903179 RepID=A0A1S1WZY3_9NEIS|nr:hypothetical protein [Chromobacterium sphagni]OHX12729.1 hypothetical protein BI347_03855 [Chromobacterium sphagni]